MRRMRSAPRLFFVTFLAAFAGVVLTASAVAAAQSVTPPDEHLGRPVGVDFKLADWEEESIYFRKLGRESPNVITKKVGTTTEGRDFLISIISSEANLANLDEIKRRSRIIADPRGRSPREVNDAVNNGTPVLFVSCAMHSTETAGSQFGMEFAYRLATSNEEPWKSAREKMVVVVYVTNPDGVDHVTNWYRETVGTPYEGAGLLRLYQYYAGHDNNRDWFMLTQKETRIVSELLYSEWFPQVYWDVHQQGSSRERFFVPPYRDPLNPNLDPGIITGIDALGSRALHDMTSAGFSGISTGVSYDMWWNGGNRNVPVRHNIIGILTEAASVNLASPIFFEREDLYPPRGLDGYQPSNRFPNPWPGGWWRLRDIIDYELAFGRSLLASITREPETWLRNKVEAARRAIEKGRQDAPRAWIIPSDNRDPDAVRKLLDILFLTGVEVHVSEDAIQADGRTYPAGSIVVNRAQPYGQHVKDLMEVQRYPEGPPPYDVSGWTAPYLLGVHRAAVNDDLSDLDLQRAESIDDALESFKGDERLRASHDLIRNRDAWSSRHSGDWTSVVKALQDDRSIRLLGRDSDLAGLFVEDAGDLRDDLGIPIDALPRIGVYAPWFGSKDEGWLRYALDAFEFPFVRVRNEMIRAGSLHDLIDVLIIPSIRGRSRPRSGRRGRDRRIRPHRRQPHHDRLIHRLGDRSLRTARRRRDPRAGFGQLLLPRQHPALNSGPRLPVDGRAARHRAALLLAFQRVPDDA